MAVATVAAGDEVRAADHNNLAGLVNGTAGYGQPTKLYDLNSSSVYALDVGNQDTTNGLIADFRYGTVGAATRVARIRKQGLDGLLLDKNGAVFHLDAYAADGITLRVANSDSAGIAALEASSAQLTANDAAWNAALAAIQAQGGGTLQLGPGTYIGPSSSVTLIDNLVIRGSGMGATVLRHRSATASGYTTTMPTLNAPSRTNVTVCDLTIDGNRTNVNGTTTGFIGTELTFGAGVNCAAVRVKFTNWNATACDLAGTNNSAVSCWVDGPSLGSYNAWSGAGGANDHNWGGVYGIICSGGTASNRIVVTECVVYGCRNNGIAIGGYGCVVTDNLVYNNHRDTSPSGSSGGQIAFQATYGTLASNAGSRNCVAAGNFVGTTTLGTSAIGIEINTGLSLAVPGRDITAIGNTIVGQTALGISIDDSTCVLVAGNMVRGTTSVGISAVIGAACTHFRIVDNVVSDTASGAGHYGIGIGNVVGTANYSVTGNHLINNGTGGTAHYNDAMAAASRVVLGNVVGSGTAPTNYLPAGGLTIAAGGLTVTAGGITMSAGQLLWPSGSAGAPSIALSGSTSGIYSTAADTVDFASAGSNSLRITSAGLVDFRTAAASVALGGGAAPTFGTIGGSGPATAGQWGWVKVLVGGTATYLPGWR